MLKGASRWLRAWYTLPLRKLSMEPQILSRVLDTPSGGTPIPSFPVDPPKSKDQGRPLRPTPSSAWLSPRETVWDRYEEEEGARVLLQVGRVGIQLDISHPLGEFQLALAVVLGDDDHV